ncbi:hypothetical protein BROSI_A0438 [Candidatus Brocadia sinica JPN1]|uniref:Uncharacterized protein n=1 Tax=Candidatus Brocadia sinica JPN1 TaxID=1197129 RepID=A0ABQ0JU22_9BACT|nr:hypothetical protein BROSI_A0438 [Candidatus Brocadia sinica JPN1]
MKTLPALIVFEKRLVGIIVFFTKLMIEILEIFYFLLDEE